MCLLRNHLNITFTISHSTALLLKHSAILAFDAFEAVARVKDIKCEGRKGDHATEECHQLRFFQGGNMGEEE